MGDRIQEDQLTIVKDWLKNVVVGLELCPFAKKPFEGDQIRLSLSLHNHPNGWHEDFVKELELLNESPKEKISTTLLILPHASQNFREFHDFVGSLEDFLEENQLSELYQLVSFHPQFIFEGLEANERGHYVNRSPFPLIHVLRSEEIALALKSIKEGENISMMNDMKLNKMNDEIFQNKFSYLTKVT